jgi:hypothetical protein
MVHWARPTPSTDHRAPGGNWLRRKRRFSGVAGMPHGTPMHSWK